VLAARNREHVQLIARDLEVRAGKPGIAHLPFDAAACDTHDDFVRAAMALGPFAGCFIACGAMHGQDAAEADWQLAQEMISVNYTGVVSVLNRLAPLLAAQDGGAFISCLTSVAGDRGRPSNFIYGSTKAGLNAYLEGLRARWHARGLRVQTVKLGPVDTPMNTGVTRVPFMVSADVAAEQIFAALAARREVAYVPRRWAVIMWVIRLLPRAVFQRMKL
jgi:decaprenylphospho-beta-D-erythro-pentofuranosid-2-ulose 2-reductase